MISSYFGLRIKGSSDYISEWRETHNGRIERILSKNPKLWREKEEIEDLPDEPQNSDLEIVEFVLIEVSPNHTSIKVERGLKIA